MSSALGSLVAGQIISKSAGEVSSVVGKLDFEFTDTKTAPSSSKAENEENYKRHLNHKEMLKKQHRKREAKRETLRREIRLKYGIEDKGMLSSRYDVVKSEKAKLVVNGDEDEYEETGCKCFCLSCFGYCFKKKPQGWEDTKKYSD